MLDDDNAAGFDDDDGALGGFFAVEEAAFGEGGEAWAKEAALEPQLRVHNNYAEPGTSGDQPVEGGVGDFDPQSGQYAVSLHHKTSTDNHEDILSYFDNALQKNWAGPEHWRIRRIKDNTKPTAPATSKRKEKEPFEIDFLSPLDPTLAELIYTPATSTAAISLPKAQWKSKTRNLLPDDKHFNSRQLLRLFLNPNARMGSRRTMRSHQSAKVEEIPPGEIDEAFWARKENTIQQPAPSEDAPQGNYDANFFQEDEHGFPGDPPDDDEDFADAREAFSPGVEGTEPAASTQTETQGIASMMTGSQEGAFGSQLVTQSRRLRPEYVQYARTATKVDVRRLKEEMWRGIGFREGPKPQADPSEPPVADETLNFTSEMSRFTPSRPWLIFRQVSASFACCFWRMRKGLSLRTSPGWTN